MVFDARRPENWQEYVTLNVILQRFCEVPGNRADIAYTHQTSKENTSTFMGSRFCSKVRRI
eukprot:1155893-Pyramimonas_sp.AAC.1